MLTQQAGRDVSHVGLLQLVILSVVLVDAKEHEGFGYGIEGESHVDEAIDEVPVVAHIPVSRLIRGASSNPNCTYPVHIPAVIILIGSSGILFPPLAQINVLSRGAGVLNSPLVSHEGEAFRVIKHHVCHLCVLWVLGVRELEEHSEGEQGRFDGLDGRPVGAEGIETDGALQKQESAMG